MNTTYPLRRVSALIGALALVLAAMLAPLMTSANQDPAATPTTTYSCDDIRAQRPFGTPWAGMPWWDGTPGAGMPHDGGMMGPRGDMMDFDLMYIDMMIPHHQSIIAMAQAALPELTDQRLIERAQAIIASQQPEIEQLREYRQAWYGSAETFPFDDTFMGAMDDMMPGAYDAMGGMAMMDATALVATFCAQPNPDVAFIDLTIPHHEGAIISSQAAVELATHPELRAFAEDVIAAQQAEVEELRMIREELTGDPNPARIPFATPAA